MNRITLKTDGYIAQGGRIVHDNPLMLLSCAVELETGFTLRSFFRMVERYDVLTKLSAFLPDCLARYRACPSSECIIDAIDRLEFCKTVEMIGFPGDPRLEIYTSLIGVRNGKTCEIRMFALEHLLDMPVRLGVLKHVIFGDKVDVFEFETAFNLFEFIDGVVWEMSFHGTPKECGLGR